MPDPEKLFPDFSPATPEQWMEQVKTELKGEPVDKLYWKTAGDIIIKPFYTLEDLPHNLLSGENPLKFPSGYLGVTWEIRQDFDAANESTANQLALEALNGGANAIGFFLKPGTDLRKLLAHIEVQHIYTHFMESINSYRILDDFLEILEEQGLNANDIRGSVSVELLEGVEEELDRKEVVDFFNEYSNALPAFRVVDVRLKEDKDRAEALGMALAKAHEYIYLLTNGGIAITDILPRLQFSTGVGTDYFVEIATLRALRLLWLKVTASYSQEVLPLFIHTENRLNSLTDPYTNMVKASTQCMAAIIGGSNSISINVPGNLERLSFLQHIARNTQLILQYEGRLDRVTDAAAGSYYMETLTRQLAEKAWTYFKEIESAGGYFSKYCMFL